MQISLLRHVTVALLLLLVLRSTRADAPVGRVIVTSGVAEHQVLQRDADGKARLTIRGKAQGEAKSSLKYRVVRRRQIVEGFDFQSITLKGNGEWETQLPGLPTGGPFDFEFLLEDSSGRELDRRKVCDVYVGDLWITAGQSNMDGCGDLAQAETPTELVHDFGFGDDWQVSEDPMHNCYESLYPVYLTSYVSRTKRNPIAYTLRGAWPTWRSDGNLGTSLGLSFGKCVAEHANVPVGLILCSLGGTTIDQWSPALKEKGGESLYGAMMIRVAKCGGKVRGVLWYQGESDCSEGASATYKEKLTQLITTIRTDLHDAELPFYAVQIGRQIVGSETSPMEKNVVRESTRQAMIAIPHTGLASAIDLGMSSSAHLDSDGYKRVGRRLAKIALAETYGNEHFKTGPSVEKIIVEGKERDILRIQFSSVNGRLFADPRVLGFSIRSSDGSNVLVDYTEAVLDPSVPDAVLLHLGQPVPAGATLWYGYGWNPICTLNDSEDMSLPAFGPLMIE